MKSLFQIVGLLLLATFVLSACGNEADENEEGISPEDIDEDETYVAIVSKGFQHQFWQSVKDGAEEAANEFNVQISFEGPEKESQIDKQIEMLRNALDRKPDALGFAALDSKASTEYLEEADANDIPVVAFDSGVDSDIPVTTASTNNYEAAALAAEHMAELIGGSGKVALVVHDQTSVTGVERRDGFVETLESDYPDIEIVDVQYGGGDHLESTDLAKAMMQAHPDLDGLYGSNEGSAIGVVNAVTELNKGDDITVIGFDSGKQQIDAIKNGIMDGAVTQDPFGIGYETVKAAVEALDGKEIESEIDTGSYWYDADNMEDKDIQKAIYE